MSRFLILGGDPRQLYLHRLLKQSGHETDLYYDMPKTPFSLKNAMEESHIILCPIPFTKDGRTICSEHGLPGLDIDTFLTCLGEKHILFGGCIPSAVKVYCDSRRIPCFDFMKMEEVAWKNAVATAEGAVAEAISLSPVNLHQSRCLVTGWGRCACTLASKLKGMDAHVTIAARDRTKLAQARSMGYSTVLLGELGSELKHYDFIFNTIPAMVLDSSLTGYIKLEAAVIDIASAPGGVDFKSLEHFGIRARLCPGLPGICAPLSSAQILYEAVMEHLELERNCLWN